MDEKGTSAPKRAELVWEGKKADVERVSLPFQRIEIVNESRATREAQKNTFLKQFDTGSSEWRNKLIWGDNKYVLGSLLQEFAGKMNLIYIDPPFATGQDFSINIEVGDQEFVKEASLIEEKAYRDTWGEGIYSYLQVMHQRLTLMRELLASTGVICVHCDWHVGHYLKTLLYEIFGMDNFIHSHPIIFSDL